jgi:ribosome recycling factor
MKEVIQKFEQESSGSIKSLKEHLGKVRTGRANVSQLDGVMVDYYGTPTPIKQVANLSTPDARTIQVQAWESSILGAIEKAIIAANLGLTPMNDGKLIRVPVPALTEERRKDLVKQTKKMGEDCKVAIRNHRRDANEALKKQEKDKQISED